MKVVVKTNLVDSITFTGDDLTWDSTGDNLVVIREDMVIAEFKKWNHIIVLDGDFDH